MTSRSRIAGSMLLEAILATAIAATLMVMAVGVQQQYERQQSGREVADAKASFIAVASQYFEANRTAMEAAMKDGTDAATWCRIGVNPDGTGGTATVDTALHTCTIDTYMLRAKNVWPAHLRLDEPDGRYAAIFKMEFDTQVPPQPTGGHFMFTPLIQPSGVLASVTKDPDAYKEMVAAMRSMGGTGGVVPVGDLIGCANDRSSATYQACGTGWQINLSEYISAPQLTIFANALPN